MYSVTKPFFLLVMSLLFSFSPDISAAESEVHFVSIYEGKVQTNDQIHGPQALVRLDRPEADVTLVLSSYRPVRWYVETVNETRIESLVLTGHGGGKSEVFVDGQRYVDTVFRGDLPRTRHPVGPGYRELIKLLPTLGDFSRLDSFTGTYSATDSPLMVTERFPDDSNLGPDHLSAHVLGPGVLSGPLRAALQAETLGIRPATRFTGSGMQMQRPDQSWQDFPLGLDVPDVSHPKGSTFVASENAIYGVSLGGDGYLYRVDASNGVWSIVQSMDGFDAGGMVYDPAGHRLIMLGHGGLSFGELLLFDLTTRTSSLHDFPVQNFTGILDLAGNSRSRGMRIEVIGIDGDQFLFRAEGVSRRENPDAPQFRVWSFDLNTGDVQLIAYADPPV